MKQVFVLNNFQIAVKILMFQSYKLDISRWNFGRKGESNLSDKNVMSTGKLFALMIYDDI